MSKTVSAWFQSNIDCEKADLKIFCFPYAGGTAAIYRDWANLLPSTVQVIPVELPGRGARLKEPRFVRLPALINSLVGPILPLLDTPFTFFGHSMGAVIAYELSRRLRREHNCGPQALFVSGRRSPQILNVDPVTYNLPKDEFIETLGKLDGIPNEVLEQVELMELMAPLLRADLQMDQTYKYVPDIPLQCPITVYGGLQDRHVTRSVLLPWRELTTSSFALHMLPGGHFFLKSSQHFLLELLSRELCDIIARSKACY
jgi:medium-chain acyl-[acyl-carrier-protein] hydrolase